MSTSGQFWVIVGSWLFNMKPLLCVTGRALYSSLWGITGKFNFADLGRSVCTARPTQGLQFQISIRWPPILGVLGNKNWDSFQLEYCNSSNKHITLNPEINLNMYLKLNFDSYRKQTVFITRASRVMLLSRIIAVYSETHMKHKYSHILLHLVV